MLRTERVKDFLLMEKDFIIEQERTAPKEDSSKEERAVVDRLRGASMRVASLEEWIDDNHAIIDVDGMQNYVPCMSFVDKDQLEPGSQVLVNSLVLLLFSYLFLALSNRWLASR